MYLLMIVKILIITLDRKGHFLVKRAPTVNVFFILSGHNLPIGPV